MYSNLKILFHKFQTVKILQNSVVKILNASNSFFYLKLNYTIKNDFILNGVNTVLSLLRNYYFLQDMVLENYSPHTEHRETESSAWSLGVGAC